MWSWEPVTKKRLNFRPAVCRRTCDFRCAQDHMSPKSCCLHPLDTMCKPDSAGKLGRPGRSLGSTHLVGHGCNAAVISCTNWCRAWEGVDCVEWLLSHQLDEGGCRDHVGMLKAGLGLMEQPGPTNHPSFLTLLKVVGYDWVASPLLHSCVRHEVGPSIHSIRRTSHNHT
jgi:hypothetical protein